ncbi:maleylpyruvate isomerase family mycothiol-dependent enzyme [Streptomyces sp. NPDC003077]|uniref:maleylpyruvate isomerase family mycothiol-dependent enzyme n=1 Tax=Streptomyces sp. NPDC003077 TaxID=3154443 RepID=UPI0033AAA3D6
MIVHPSLQSYADAWSHSIDAISELVKPLVEGEWSRPTELPGWSVRDIVSHIIGLESEMLGDPRPIHSLPRDLFHVKTDFARRMELQVDVRRHHTGPEMTAELEYIVLRRKRALREDTRDPETVVRSPLGEDRSLKYILRQRAFDVWVHEQDLRRALGHPGNLDSPGGQLTRDLFLLVLPKVVMKDGGAPAGSSIVFDVSGPLEFMRTVRVDETGQATLDSSVSLGPTATIATDWETYLRLACGRVKPAAVADRVKIEGDRDLAQGILDRFAFTP